VNTSLTVDPVWPWSQPAIGLTALAAVTLLLVLLTLWTYLGSPQASFRRVLVVLLLRLGALLVACLLVLRPSLAEYDESANTSRLLILIDASESMNISDEIGSQSRWQAALRILNAPEVQELLDKLKTERKLEVIVYRGAGDVANFDPDGLADGKRTDMGQWFQSLLKKHGRDTQLLGLLIFSDGADNGTAHPTLREAGSFRAGACAVHTFGLGSSTTTLKQQDIAFVRFTPEPTSVVAKGKLTVRAEVNAPGFEGTHTNLHLFLDDKLVKSERIQLLKTQGNEVEITAPAPVKAGEVKVTMKIDAQKGEVTDVNNQISTYCTVTREGLSILWVEGKKRLESAFALRFALRRDPMKRFNVTYVERLDDNEAMPAEDVFDFNRQAYDVIVIGDISARRFTGGDKSILKKIGALVKEKGTGLMMLGGAETFGGDWGSFALEEFRNLFPVRFDVLGSGQIEGLIRMVPEKSAKDYLLRLADDPNANESLWARKELQLIGMTQLGSPWPEGTKMAESAEGKLIMAAKQTGTGRVLAFGGDSTWKWRKDPDSIAAHERFWKQVILWLAQQDKAEGNVWVRLDKRRVMANDNQGVGFKVGLRGKNGQDIPDGRFTAKVITPQNAEIPITTSPERGQEGGSFWKITAPGEYRIVVHGEGKDADGSPIKGEAEGRFLAYSTDLENARPGADLAFLQRLAAVGGGRYRKAGERELVQFLEELRGQSVPQLRPRGAVCPDWRRNPASGSLADQAGTLWASGLLLSFVLFVTFLCVEWYLRRRWGMV
jgi:hypothetical protein